MNKDDNIEILNLIAQKKRQHGSVEHSQSIRSTQPEPAHRDVNGTPLEVGDKVVLLTAGRDNLTGEEATIRKANPNLKTIKVRPRTFARRGFHYNIRKKGKSVRKIE